MKPRERLRVDSASESRRRCLRPSWTSSPVSSAMTVPRYYTVSTSLSKNEVFHCEVRLHVIVDGLGRSMCSRRCQCGICVNRSPLHHKALLVYAAAMTYWWIESGNYIMWNLPFGTVISLTKAWLAWWLWCSCIRVHVCSSPTTVNSFGEGHYIRIATGYVSSAVAESKVSQRSFSLEHQS